MKTRRDCPRGVSILLASFIMMRILTVVISTSSLLAPPAAKKTQVKLGVCDWTIEKSGDPAALELAAKLGLEGVQVSLNIKDDFLLLAGESLQKAYLEAAKKSGVEIASFALGDLNNFPLQRTRAPRNGSAKASPSAKL